jgi:thymidylate synthase
MEITLIYHDHQYQGLIDQILKTGKDRTDRTGVGTRAVFDTSMRFDLTKGFPLLTTKKLHWKSIIWELLWFLSGETNNNWLKDRGVTIWDEWALEDGSLGPIYGKQWRSWPSYSLDYQEVETSPGVWEFQESMKVDFIDQLAKVVETLKTNPTDRRMIVSAWNVSDIPKMQLPPCHCFYQFFVEGDKLSCSLWQRSCDVGLGVPYNVASYAALVHIIARITGLKPGVFNWHGGDTHIYLNHIDQMYEQLSRSAPPSPTLTIAPDAPVGLDGDWHRDHFIIDGYNPLPPIKMEVAV